MLQPTAKQIQVLAFVRGVIHAKGRAPSIREIQSQFGLRSPNGVVRHLDALTKKGLIQRDPGARALRLLEPKPSFAFAYGGKIS